ncbi:MAG: Flp pilus assembly protein CpaB [Actinobacteria bacterium]|nr:Flp pilus assembly protein CpaB [Actinomycetota bacterium]
MSSRRTLILVAALVIGGIAAVLLYGYVNGIQDRAYGKTNRIKVFVVKTQVPRGRYGEEVKSEGLVVESKIPQEFYPPNAIRSLDDIAGKQAINNLAPNQIVTSDMFADPATVSETFADRLEKIRGTDQVAISFRVSQMHAVAGLLQPGDYVNVMLTNMCDEALITALAGPDAVAPGAATTATPNCDKYKSLNFVYQTRVLYQKVRILAIDKTPIAQPGEVKSASSTSTSTDSSATASSNSGMITVIVPQKAAQVIASLIKDNEDNAPNFYLTLVSRDYKPKAQGSIDPTAPLPGEDPKQLTPYGPDGAEAK